MGEIYDLIVIGGGPAGVAAGVYAGRKQLRTLLITKDFSGQSVVSDKIENWIGEVSISGYDLMKKLEAHVRAQQSVTIETAKEVIRVEENSGNFRVTVRDGGLYDARTLVITSGGRRRKLDIPGEKEFDGKGVAYCSTCDAPLFRGKAVAVVGGGNAGFEAAIDLLPYASAITLLNMSDAPQADAKTIMEVKKSGRVTLMNRVRPIEIFGERSVRALRYKNLLSGEEGTLDVGGIFVEVGSVPNSEFVKGFVDMNEHNEIVVDHRTLATSRAGVFAAGDVTDELYKQNNTAVGDAVSAVLSAYNYLLNIRKNSPAAEK